MNEALKLSERKLSVDCLDKIRQKLEHAIDHRSHRLIATHIELLQ